MHPLRIYVAKENCELRSSHEKDENRKSYFIDLVGDADHAYYHLLLNEVPGSPIGLPGTFCFPMESGCVNILCDKSVMVFFP